MFSIRPAVIFFFSERLPAKIVSSWWKYAQYYAATTCRNCEWNLLFVLQVNGRMILEGVLRIYWGVRNVIHLKEEDDQRTIAVRRRSMANSTDFYSDSEDEVRKTSALLLLYFPCFFLMVSLMLAK